MRGKPLGGQRGLVGVAARQHHAADTQFAGRAIGDRLQRLVEEVRGAAGDRLSDGDRCPGLDPSAHHRHGAFGGAVAVLQPTAGRPPIGEILRQRFTADVDEGEVGERLARALTASGPQQRGRGAEDGDPFLLEPRDEIRPQPHGSVIEEDERGPHAEGEPRLLDGGVVGR